MISGKARRFTKTCTHSGGGGRDCRRDGVALPDVAFADPLARTVPAALLFADYLCRHLFRLARRPGGVGTVSALCYIPHILHAWHHTCPQLRHESVRRDHCVFPGRNGYRRFGRSGDGPTEWRNWRPPPKSSPRRIAISRTALSRSKGRIRLSAIGHLSASLAHEIRNPLASIDGAANLIESAQTSEEMRRNSLAIIHKEIQRLNRLLTSLLNFARPRKPEFQPAEPSRLFDANYQPHGPFRPTKGNHDSQRCSAVSARVRV